MSAKIRNQKFSAMLKKANANFLLEVILFFWTKGLLNTSSHLY